MAASPCRRCIRREIPYTSAAHVRAVKGGNAMSVARVTEISASSPTSFEDALQVGIARAVKTLKNVEGAWIQEQKVVVRNGADLRVPGQHEGDLRARGVTACPAASS